MKIKKTIEQEVEVDVTFPFYVEHGWSHYMVTSENSLISVHMTGRKQKGFVIDNDAAWLVPTLATSAGASSITKEQFDRTFEQALGWGIRELNTQTSEPATYEDIREKIEAEALYEAAEFDL